MHIPLPLSAPPSTAGTPLLLLLLLFCLLSWAAAVDRITRTFVEAAARRLGTATRCKSLYQINELIKIRLAITVLTISAPVRAFSLSLSHTRFIVISFPLPATAHAAHGQKICCARSNHTGETSLTAAAVAAAAVSPLWHVASGESGTWHMATTRWGFHSLLEPLYNIHKNHTNNCGSLSLFLSPLLCCSPVNSEIVWPGNK